MNHRRFVEQSFLYNLLMELFYSHCHFSHEVDQPRPLYHFHLNPRRYRHRTTILERGLPNLLFIFLT